MMHEGDKQMGWVPEKELGSKECVCVLSDSE